MNNWDGGGDVKHGRRELQAKLKLSEARLKRRVAVTKAMKLPAPRLEVIVGRRHRWMNRGDIVWRGVLWGER
jgi:hypothetical protein